MKKRQRVTKGEKIEKFVKNADGKVERVKVQREHIALRVPKDFRRLDRMVKNGAATIDNKGNIVGTAGFVIGFNFWNSQAIYIPPGKRFKGWQRENRRYRNAS